MKQGTKNRRQRGRALAIDLIRKAGGSAFPGTSRDDLMAALKQIGACPRNLSGLGQWFMHWKRQQAPFLPNTTALKMKKAPPAEDFLKSWAWTQLRYRVLKKHGRRCMVCGRTPDDGIKIHVDHIKPRHTHPELALDEGNLQVLCEDCNKGKGAWDETDWRGSGSA